MSKLAISQKPLILEQKVASMTPTKIGFSMGVKYDQLINKSSSY